MTNCYETFIAFAYAAIAQAVRLRFLWHIGYAVTLFLKNGLTGWHGLNRVAKG